MVTSFAHPREAILRRACFVVALALIPFAASPRVRAQTIVTHSAGGPARLDGPWLLYESDPPGGISASADSRLGRIYTLSTEQIPSQGAKTVWLRATVTPDELPSDPALLVNPNAGDCQVFVNGQKAETVANGRAQLVPRVAGCSCICLPGRPRSQFASSDPSVDLQEFLAGVTCSSAMR